MYPVMLAETNTNERRRSSVQVKGVLCLEKPFSCFQITVNSLMKCFHSVKKKKKAISSVFLSADEIRTDTAELTWTVVKLYLLKQGLG